MSRSTFITVITIIISLIGFASLHAAPVNINTADAQTLADSLNGIGLKKAHAIVDFRASNGDFKTINELSLVKGIGEGLILRNRDDLTLNASDLAERIQNPINQSKTMDKKQVKTVMARSE